MKRTPAIERKRRPTSAEERAHLDQIDRAAKKRKARHAASRKRKRH
jgi:hypothetical protein